MLIFYSLAVQWLELWAFTAEGPSSIPGQGTKIPQIVCWDQKKKGKSKQKSKSYELNVNILI